MLEKRLSDELPPSILECLAPMFEKAARRLDSMGAASSNPVLTWQKKVANISSNQYRIPAKHNATVQTEVLTALYNGNQLRLKYPDASKQREWNVHPLGVVLRGPVTYLVCYIGDSSKEYMLPLHRIRAAAELTTDRANVRGFSLARFVEKGRADFVISDVVSGQDIQLVADFDKELSQSLKETPLTKDQTLTPIDEASARLTARVRDTLQLRWWLLGYGSRVTVLMPKELQKWIADEHRKSVKLYD
jgi:predicted DNA-binding transcriptional regulator YafY